MSETAGYITGPNGPLYATWHAPARAGGPTVLAAGPFGEERKCAYRLMARTAQALAAAGCGVLRVDVAGTGESGGEHATASLTSWRADLATAASTARKLGGDGPLALWGVRLGANLLAGLTPEQAAGADTLLAWAPLLRGQELLDDLLRRKQIKEMLGAGAASSDTEAIRVQWAAGAAVDVDGFAVSAALAAELAELDLLADLAGPGAGRRALLLHCSGARGLRGDWADAAARVAALGGELRLLRERPFWGRTDVPWSVPLWDASAGFLDLALSGGV